MSIKHITIINEIRENLDRVERGNSEAGWRIVQLIQQLDEQNQKTRDTNAELTEAFPERKNLNNFRALARNKNCQYLAEAGYNVSTALYLKKYDSTDEIKRFAPTMSIYQIKSLESQDKPPVEKLDKFDRLQKLGDEILDSSDLDSFHDMIQRARANADAIAEQKLNEKRAKNLAKAQDALRKICEAGGFDVSEIINNI